MKTIISLFFLFFSIFAYSQIQPTDSPYYSDGVFSIIADSTTISSKKVVMYRPHLPPVTKYPVFIFQPGANGIMGGDINVHTYDLFLHHLTTYGFVVLVIDETTAGMPSGTTFKSVHTWLKGKMADSTHWLYTYGDPSKVIIGGHSNGGVNASGLLVERPTEIHGIVYFASYPSDNILMPHNVSGYTGKVLSLAGSEDNSSTPTACKNGYNAFTSAGCKNYALITGLGHAGFGDYVHSSQVVGNIGRVNATASIRHYFLSFMLGQFYNDPAAMANLTQTNLQPNTTGEFLSNCGSTVNSDNLFFGTITIYPSAASSHIFVEIPDYINNYYEIELYNIAGQKLFPSVLVDSFLTSINISTLKKGFYIIKVQSDANTIIKKICII